VFNFAVRHAEG